MGRKKQSQHKQQKAMKRRRRSKGGLQKNVRRKSIFLEGKDSYIPEYERLICSKMVKSLKGIYELEDEAYYNLSLEDKLEHIGLTGHSIIYYDSECDNEKEKHDDSIIKGTGSTVAVTDSMSTISPLIFIRKRVVLGEGDEMDEDIDIEIAYGIRMLVLLHELGHADDIEKGINFNHVERKLDLINAEVYAHCFVCKQAKIRNYRMALGYYLENIDDGLKSEIEYVRLVSERFYEENDVDQLKAMCRNTNVLL